MVLGVIWTFGLLGYTGFRLSIVTIAGLPILIGLGVEFAIQVQNRIEEEIIAELEADAVRRRRLSHIGPALLVATVAAVIACLALKASLTPMIRDFGVLLAVGIVLVFLAALVVPTALLSIREAPQADDRRAAPAGGRSDDDQARSPPAVVRDPVLIVAAVAFLVGGLFAEERTPIQTDPNKWVDQYSQVIHDINYDAGADRAPRASSACSCAIPAACSPTR